jgi:hypothetical protein
VKCRTRRRRELQGHGISDDQQSGRNVLVEQDSVDRSEADGLLNLKVDVLSCRGHAPNGFEVDQPDAQTTLCQDRGLLETSLPRTTVRLPVVEEHHVVVPRRCRGAGNTFEE